MNPLPRVSIIINNYNYGRFLARAIESALEQDYPLVEIIVVDDGSTDDSRQVIDRYRGKIIAVLKENGGQASTFNAGFACSTGEMVIFLDADDYLAPETAGRVAAIFQARPGVVKVHYRLEMVDASGLSTGETQPLMGRPLPEGNLRRQLFAFPDDIAWQPTSGNALAASLLRQILPMPEEAYRICADYYLSALPPLFGEVAALNLAGAYYRVHDANNHYTGKVDLERVRQVILRTRQTHLFIRQESVKLGVPGFPANPCAVHSVSFLANRVVSLRLDPKNHPIPEDTRWRLFWRGARSALGRFDLSWTARLARAAWFVAALLLPRPAVRWLADAYFHPKQASHISRVAGLFRAIVSRDVLPDAKLIPGSDGEEYPV